MTGNPRGAGKINGRPVTKKIKLAHTKPMTFFNEQAAAGQSISADLEHNIQRLETLFAGNGDMVKRKFKIGNTHHHAYVLFIDNMANSLAIEQGIIRPMLYHAQLTHERAAADYFRAKNLFNALSDSVFMAADFKPSDDFEACVSAVMSGDTAVFISGYSQAYIIASRGFAGRGVPETQTEIVVQGSKEAFAESLRTNTMLIRRRLRDTNLVIEQSSVGHATRTDMAMVYMKSLVREQVLADIQVKVASLQVDAIMDIGYLEQYIEGDYLSPFPQCQITERPDKAVSALLEGRVLLMVDNSPFALIVPTVLACFFQSPEDYYNRFEIASMNRLLRYVGAVIAMVLPGLYVAIALYHPNMIPTELLLAMAQARLRVPFPALVEILLMDVAFELLKEAGLRLPSAISSAMGVVGGIIIGQAAVEAGLVSPIVVIIVALTAIAGFTLPTISLAPGIRISKYVILFTSAVLGLLGFWLGCLVVLIHLASLKSFGFPYLYPFVSGDMNEGQDWQDTVVRPPLFRMKRRPIFTKAGARMSRVHHVRKGGVS